MRSRSNRRFPRQALNAAGTRRCLDTVGIRLAPRLKAGTAVDTGETAASTTVETGHYSSTGDRPAVHIVQTGAPVPQNWRQDRDYMIRSLGRSGR